MAKFLTMEWELILFLTGLLSISAGCLIPANWLPPLPNDKLLHFLAYGGMAMLIVRLAKDGPFLLLSLAGLFLSGWLIEVLQHWVPGRRFCWRDLAANTAGIITAVLLSQVLFTS